MKSSTRIELHILLPFLIALIVVGGNAVASYYSLRTLRGVQAPVAHTQNVISRITRLSGSLMQAETLLRGYVLTQSPNYLRPFKQAQLDSRATLDELAALLHAMPDQYKRIQLLQGLFQTQSSEMSHILELAQRGNTRQAVELVKENTDQHLMGDMQQTLTQMLNVEEQRFEDSTLHMHNATRWVMAAAVEGVALNTLLLLVLYRRVARALEDRRKDEAVLLRQNKELDATLHQIEQYNLRNSMMSEMSKLLQVCNDMAEAFKVVSAYLPPLLPGTSAGLYLFSASRNDLELVSSWGGSEFDGHILPEDCWAIRKGQMFYNHQAGNSDRLACKHEHNGCEGCCIPLTAQGEIVGLFTLHYEVDNLPDTTLLTSICEHISLTISNIKLKHELRQQSIKDPLTGLNNRRMFDDALTRELARHKRTGQPFSVIMMDIDYFKHYNDSYGHEAGDRVLKLVSQVLSDFTRSSDIVCRYGGEEFCLLLPDTNLTSAAEKAEELRTRISRLHIREHGVKLEPVSMSFGVAMAPWHGDTAELLVRQADIALYQAKSAGRNCVVLAKIPPAAEEAAGPG